MSSPRQRIVILDFGSQYTQLIARRVRELQVYSEVHPFDLSLDEIRALAPAGIILSGGPASVAEGDSPRPDPGVLELGVPVLGICYGQQVMAAMLGAEVSRGETREFGSAQLEVVRGGARENLFRGLPTGDQIQVWMSHGDAVNALPAGFDVIGRSAGAQYAAIANESKGWYGVQFHPEVHHTPSGREILGNFVHRICGCASDWTMGAFVEENIAALRERIGSAGVLCGLSGGVDSTVLAALLHRAIGDQLTCILVDNGVLRKDEAQGVVEALSAQKLDIRVVDAGERFLNALKGIEEPEKKRKTIGREFIAVFEEEASRLEGPKVEYLAQGTLYPDVIESVSHRGPSATIKTHHNVGGLPEVMKLDLIEPFRELFKDEVRAVGRELGLDEVIIGRHPFPGPGLAVRILGEVRADRVAMLQAADHIAIQEIRAAGLYDEIWQAFCVLLPVNTVGVMGDERTYENAVALRCVTSTDGMTADWYPMDTKVLARISSRIINEVPGINRVVYDISSKPPATIEWE